MSDGGVVNLAEKLSLFRDHWHPRVVAELNRGQLRTILRDRFLVDAKGLNKIQGKPFKVAELLAVLYDEVLNVHTRISNIGDSSLTWEFSIHKDASDQLVATGHVVAVNVGKEARRPMRVPDALRRAVKEYER